MRLSIFGLLPIAATLMAAAPVPAYRVVDRIAGPDGAGWDYAKVDPATHRLYVAHGDAVTVIDLSRPKETRSIGVIEHGHAVLPIPGSSILLVTSGHDASVRLIDLRDGREAHRIAVGENPDAAIWDPARKRALVMNAESGSVSEIDVAAAKVTRTIPVKPALEYAAIGKGDTLFVNDEDANEIEVIDLASGKHGGAIPLTGCEGPTGLAYDKSSDTLIGACANGKAAVVDAGKRRLVRLLDIGKGPDAVILDATRRLAFIPCGKDGVLEVLSLDAAGGVAVADTVKTEVGARTGALDPSDGALYLPTAGFAAPASPGTRAAVIPGTFHIVVVRPS